MDNEQLNNNLNEESSQNHHPSSQHNNFNIQFENGENPFSFYDTSNHRGSNSSEDESGQYQKEQEKANIQIKSQKSYLQKQKPIIENESLKETSIQIGQNLSQKPAINKNNSPKSQLTCISQNNQFIQTKVDLAFLKEEVDLSKLLKPSIIDVPKKKSEDEYRNEMQKDLESLKNSMKGKDVKKKANIFSEFKKEDKVNLNKTYAPIPKNKLFSNQYNAEIEVEEIRMLIKMAFQKKKANYQMLKQWDKKRAQNMALHGKMIEMLQNQIDQRIKSSLENFEHYQTFFRQKAKQQQKYYTSPVINTRYALQNNSLSKNVYINCSVILNSLCDENTQRCKKISDFVHLIRITILKELTQNHLNQSQKQLLKIREKISTLKSSLKKHHTQTQEKTSELAAFFNQQSTNITNKAEKDFYRSQLSFLRQASQQINVQKKLGQYCLEYYHAAVQEQIKRSQIIREAMLTYSKGLKQTYNLELDEMEIEQLSKYEEIKLIQEFYAIDDMFDSRSIQIFKFKNHMKQEDQLTIDNFTSYINKFCYEPFDSRIILLKQFNVKLINSGKSKDPEQENCYLVLTVDNFLHLFFTKQKSDIYSRPDVTIKISSKQMELKMVKDELIDIIKKEEKRNSMMSYFWDNKVEKTYRIRFAKKDNKEEFIDYIRKLMIDLF